MEWIGPKEFESMYKENYVHLLLVSFAIVKDRTIAEDIVQSFFESVWKKRETLMIRENFKSYGISAVRKLSLKQLQKKEKERQVFNEAVRLRSNTAFENHNRHDVKLERVNKIIQSIPESRRNIFLDFVLGGLSYKEIAETRNISINTVKAQMRRVYDFIKKMEVSEFSILTAWGILNYFV